MKLLTMTAPNYPLNELQRQNVVNSYQLLDTAPEPSYDGITALAASICNAPVALLTLVDGERNWFKSKIGVPFEESPRAISFCGHAILNPNEMMVIPDARKDQRFADNPLVAEMKAAIFYCGVPIQSADGMPLGTLCVFDNKPRRITSTQRQSMKALGFQAEQLLEQRRQYLKAKRLNKVLHDNNEVLKKFAAVAAHDLKLPIASIVTTADILKKKHHNALDFEGLERLDLIKKCSFTLNTYITAMLEFYSTGVLAEKQFSMFTLNEMFQTVLSMMLPENTSIFNLPEETHIITSNQLALIQIFTNLISNSLKYNDKPQCVIDINFKEDLNRYYFSVTDNGQGIPTDKIDTAFNLFTAIAAADKNNEKGTGVGLATVKRLVESLQGDITITSDIGKNTTVSFSVKKPTKAPVN